MEVLKHKNYEIEYFVYGQGEKVLFAFHGFNNHAEDFHVLALFPGNEFKVVSINIFFHGESYAHDSIVEKGFSMDELTELFKGLIALFPTKKYSLIGYSLGGRIVLKLMELFPEMIDKIILLAPDGIVISRFYLFLTRTSVGQFLLKRVVNRPSFFFRLAKMLKSLKLVSEKKFQFAMNNFETEQKRMKVYLVWMTLRKIISRKKDLKMIIKKYNIHLYLFFGKHDQIIPMSIGQNFQKGMENLIKLNILDAGHRLLKEKPLFEVAEIIHSIKNDA